MAVAALRDTEGVPLRLRRHFTPLRPGCGRPAARWAFAAGFAGSVVFAGLAVLLAAFLAPGCGGPPVQQRPEAAAPDSVSGLGPGPEPDLQGPPPQECDILGGTALGGGAFVFALGDSVRPERAPVPHNPSERIVFSHLYETLVTVDCRGRASPGLAAHWACTQDSTVWVFTLREDARFWDGSRITAEEVRQAWCANQDCPVGSAGGSPWTWLNARAQTVTVVDARRLAVRLPEPQASFPLLLAHPATAVAAARQGRAWPLGSGCAQVHPDTLAPPADLVCRPNPHHSAPAAWQELTFRIQPGRDPRDLAGTGVDLLLVRTLNEIEFFKAAPGFRAAPLPWSRLYLLVCPPQSNPGAGCAWWLTSVGEGAIPQLAGVDWRPWDKLEFPAWTGEDCPQLTGPVADRSSAPVQWELARENLDGRCLSFLQEDPAARELAEFLAARTPQPVRTVALPADQLAFALQWQMAGALILTCPLQYPTGCLQLAALLSQASWLQGAALGDPGGQRAADPTEALKRLGVVRSLGLSRSWLVSRGDLAGVALAFDGTPLLGGLGRLEPTP